MIGKKNSSKTSSPRRRLAEVLETEGRLPGLGAVRAFAVLALVAYQAFDLTASFALVVQTPLWIMRPAAIAMLFATLGLTFGPSAQRHPPREFAIRRFTRAWPILAVAIVVIAALIGPSATTTPLQVYFIDRQFWLYFANLLGWPQFLLPGVFDTNSVAQTVSAAMWMVPCFAFLAGTALLAAHPRLRRELVLPGAGLLALAVVFAVNNRGVPLLGEASLTRAEGIGLPLIAVLSGLFGLTAGFYPAHWRIDRRVFWLAGLVLAIAAVVGSRDLLSNPLFAALITAAAGYFAIYRAARRSRFEHRADRVQSGLLAFLLVSYPLQQLIVALGTGRQGAIGNSFLALPLAALLAFFVQLLVKRILRRTPLERHAPAAPVGGAVAMRLPQETLRDEIARNLGSALIVVLVIVLLLAVFALTLFAFQPAKVGV